MNSKIAVGQRFPDYELPDHTKTPRKLSDLQGKADPMLVVLIRGFFCPKDREQLKELTRFHPQLVVGSCHLVVITTDDWHTTNNLRQQLGASYPFLYDERKQVRDDEDALTDLLNERSRGGWEPTLMTQDGLRLTVIFSRPGEREG